MRRRVPRLRVLVVPAVAFAIALGAFTALNGTAAQPPDAGAGRPVARTLDERITELRRVASSAGREAAPYAELGVAYLQKSRETFDPAYYARADEALRRALVRDPRDAVATVATAELALARHDFRAGLRHARAARRIAPNDVAPYGVLVDALVELGRYDEAARALQRMIDLKPNLASYARTSYFRELHGDLRGATEAMRLAVAAGGGAAENVAYVQTLLGNLLFIRGELGAAHDAYATALAGLPRYLPAQAGLARVAAARGRLGEAIRRYRPVVDRLPLPEYAIALGEAQLAAGRRAQADDTLDLVRVQRVLLASDGVDTDVELAIFEAGHGDPARAVRLARRAWAAAPSVRSADALGWALTRAGRADEGLRWAERSLARGWRDPTVLFHAGIAARDAGDERAARTYLRRSLALNERFSPLWGPRAARALERLG
jgi:pentatricopeptide repeat protein